MRVLKNRMLAAYHCLFSRNFLLVHNVCEIDQAGEKGTSITLLSRTDFDIERDMFALTTAATIKYNQLTPERRAIIFASKT